MNNTTGSPVRSLTSIVYKVGLLAMCIGIVWFGINGASLMEVVSRAFLVSMAVMIICSAILIVIVIHGNKNPEQDRQMQDRRKGIEENTTDR